GAVRGYPRGGDRADRPLSHDRRDQQQRERPPRGGADWHGRPGAPEAAGRPGHRDRKEARHTPRAERDRGAPGAAARGEFRGAPQTGRGPARPGPRGGRPTGGFAAPGRPDAPGGGYGERARRQGPARDERRGAQSSWHGRDRAGDSRGRPGP